jgi:hypothetical protein
VPSKLSVTVVPPPPPPPPPPVDSSGSKRIQSKCDIGRFGAWSDSAAGPIWAGASLNALIGAVRPTGRNVSPSKE